MSASFFNGHSYRCYSCSIQFFFILFKSTFNKLHSTKKTRTSQEEEKESEYMHVCRRKRKRERPHDFYLSENMYHIILPGRMQTEEWLEYLHQNPKTHQSDTHLAQ